MVELFKDPLLVGLGNPRPGILHRNHEFTPRRAHLNADLAGVGELDGVPDQIGDHLPDLPRITVSRRKLGRQPHLQGEAFPGRLGLQLGAHTFDDLRQGVRTERHREPTGFDLREKQHVFDE